MNLNTSYKLCRKSSRNSKFIKIDKSKYTIICNMYVYHLLFQQFTIPVFLNCTYSAYCLLLM